MADSFTTLAPLVRLRGIARSYPGVKAVDGVDFDLLPGEVHCLIGENGAGKSTLMRILAGAEAPDKGTIEIQGQSYRALTPRQAISLGITIIYQERDLVPYYSVAENIYLGHEPVNAWGGIDRHELRSLARTRLSELGIDLPVDVAVESLGPAQQQYVQIAKALSRESRVLIMDEPGAVLSDHELRALFEVIARLKAHGLGIIYISHRLGEMLSIGDRVSVMRQGQLVRTAPVGAVSLPNLIELMVGRHVEDRFRKPATVQDEVALSVRHLEVNGRLHDISFDVRRGEIVGLAGLIGAGRSRLLACLLGSEQIDAGEIYLSGQAVSITSPRNGVRLGIGLVPEERREAGIIVGRSVSENVVLPIIDRHARFGVLDARSIAALVEGYIARLNIVTPSAAQRAGNLSGGNQQKVILARWLAANTRLLLLDEPTRGVDVGAKSEIYELIFELARQGLALVLVSSDLPEVIGLSDRVLVMAGGAITGEFAASQATQEAILEKAVPESRLAFQQENIQ